MLHRSMLHATEASCNRSMVIAARNQAAEPLHANATDAHTDEDWALLKTGLNWSRRTAQLNHAACYTFCTRAHRLATIHSVQRDRRRRTHKRDRSCTKYTR